MTTQVAPSVPTKRLAAAILSTDMSFTLNNILSWDGVNNLVAGDFGTSGRGVFRSPDNSQIEFFTWDPSTVAGSAITITARGLDYKGGTADGVKTKYNWPANSTLVELGSNPPAEEEDYVDKLSDETIAGIKTFSSSPIIPTGGSGTQAANATDIANAITGASGTATTLLFGTVKITTATQTVVSTDDTRVGTANQVLAAVGDDTTIAVGSGNKFVTQTGLQNGSESYAVTTGSANAYVLTLSPIPTAYKAGQLFKFTSNFANTASATLNVNSLGAKTIKKLDGATNLASGDIASGQTVVVIYDGTNMVMQTPIANTVSATVHKNGTATRDAAAASSAQTIAHGLGVIPKKVKITALYTTSNLRVDSFGVYNGTTNSSVYRFTNESTPSGTSNVDTTNGVHMEVLTGGTNFGVITFDSTNITITWTVSTGVGAGGTNIVIMWEAEV